MMPSIICYLFYTVLWFSHIGKTFADFGVLFGYNTQSPQMSSSFCIAYNPYLGQIAKELHNAEKLPLLDLLPSEFCDDKTAPPGMKGAAAAVMRGSCTFTEKARSVQQHGGKAAIVVSQDLIEPGLNMSEDLKDITIALAVIDSESFGQLKSLGSKDASAITVQLYVPPRPMFEWNAILIWFIATGTVALGAYWSGIVKYRVFLRKGHKRGDENANATRPEAENSSEEEEAQEELLSKQISPVIVFIWIVVMCAMLVLLYFFYNYLVYVVIVLFCLASSQSMYSCLKTVMLKIHCIGNCSVRVWKRRRWEVRRIVLALMCIGLGIWFGIERNASYGWILQDILGIAFCINLMKTIRLGSLKVITILLVLLFVYDIFFVFITPLFTKDRQSIMVSVATGGDSKEMIPMVVKVPRLTGELAALCEMQFSLLGFGDILLPGLLVSYCHGFDLIVQSRRRIYFVTGIITYGIGLIVTFVALALMQQGQPALLYLVPCTLLPSIAIALWRHEMRHFWTGQLPAEELKVDENATGHNGTTAVVEDGGRELVEEAGEASGDMETASTDAGAPYQTGEKVQLIDVD